MINISGYMVPSTLVSHVILSFIYGHMCPYTHTLLPWCIPAAYVSVDTSNIYLSSGYYIITHNVLAYKRKPCLPCSIYKLLRSTSAVLLG